MSSKSRRKRARRKKKKLSQPNTSGTTPNFTNPPMPKTKQLGEQKPSFFGRTYGLLTFVATVVGLIGSYLYLRPSVEIEVPSSNMTDAESLFYRPFVIRNNSPWLSVYDVHVMCTVQRIVRGSPDKPVVEFMNASPDYVPPIRELVAGERHSVPCMENVESSKPVISADVTLSLDYYRPRFFLGHTATEQGYRAVLATNGSAFWTPYVQHK